MKLSNTFKSALAGGLILASQEGCHVPADDCVVLANQSNAVELTSKEAVQAHCANPNNLIASTHQNLLTCVEGISRDNKSLVTYNIYCQDPGLNDTLDQVFDNDGAYCLSTGAKVDCSGDAVVPQPVEPKIDCDIEANSPDSVILKNQTDVEKLCADSSADPVQKSFTCIEQFSADGNSLLYKNIACADAGASTELQEVFAYENAYCVSAGATVNCVPKK